VIRCKHFLANPKRVAVQQLRRRTVAESTLRHGESGEGRRDVGMTITRGTRDLEQAIEKGLRARVVRLSEVQPAQLVERCDERRMLGAQAAFADGDGFRKEPLGLRGSPELLLEDSEADVRRRVLSMEDWMVPGGLDGGAQCRDGRRPIASADRQSRRLHQLRVFLACVIHV
jgi:hypothetical protein